MKPLDLPKLISHIDLMLARETKQVTWLEARVKESSGKPEEPKLRKSLVDSQKLVDDLLDARLDFMALREKT